MSSGDMYSEPSYEDVKNDVSGSPASGFDISSGLTCFIIVIMFIVLVVYLVSR